VTSIVRVVLRLVIAAAAVLALAAWIAISRPLAVRAPVSVRVSAEAGFGGSIVAGLLPGIALSSDGSTIAFSGRTPQDGRTRLFIRRLDTLAATVLPGTEDGADPFFSADGQWLGFSARGKLFKVSLAGGAPVALADVHLDRGAAWGEDDVITFQPDATSGGRLLRVPSGGGTPTPLGAMVPGHLTQRWPQALPGNRAILYTGAPTVDSFEDGCLVVQTLDTAAPRLVQCGGYFWRYVPGGHVLCVHEGTVYAAPFDAAQLKVSGPGVPVIEQVRAVATSGAAQFSVAGNGLLVYLAGDGSQAGPPQLVDRSGTGRPLPGVPAGWQGMSFSPNGRELAFEVSGPNQGLWLYDVEREASTRLTFDKRDLSPVWAPDGRRISYGSARGGPPNIAWTPADGSGTSALLTHSPLVQTPTSWSPDARTLAFTQSSGPNQADVWLLPIEEDPATGLTAGTPRAFACQHNDTQKCHSPRRTSRAGMVLYAGTTTYSAKDVEAGTGGLSSISPSTCSWTASYIRRSVSSRVAPVATHPGKSGEYAE
jgi:hypothetical protein